MARRGLLARRVQAQSPQELERVERVRPVVRPRPAAPLAVRPLQREQLGAPAFGGDPGPLGSDDVRRLVRQVAHHLPADRWIGVEQPIEDGHIPLSQAPGRIRYAQGMTESYRLGPDHDAMVAYITETYPGVDVVTAMGATFFSLDAETHWPNFATIVTTDEHDEGAPSNLGARPDVYRLNIGVSRATFDRLVGGDDRPGLRGPRPDSSPTPCMPQQHWVSILGPSDETFETVVQPLLGEAHDRLAATRARHRRRAVRNCTGRPRHRLTRGIQPYGCMHAGHIDADRVFAALADATRRDIVMRAIGGREGVVELAEHYPMSFAAVQKHVAVLERAGLVTKERTGRRKVVTTNMEALRRGAGPARPLRSACGAAASIA